MNQARQGSTDKKSPPLGADLTEANVMFWVIVWLGTVAAGGLFGLIAGPLGLILGCFMAVVVGTPIQITAAVLMWMCRLSRLRVAVAGAAGALSGVVATKLALEGVHGSDSYLLVFSGFLGMLGAALPGAYYWSRWGSAVENVDVAVAAWQFTLRDLFLRITAIAVLVTIWSAVVKMLR